MFSPLIAKAHLSWLFAAVLLGVIASIPWLHSTAAQSPTQITLVAVPNTAVPNSTQLPEYVPNQVIVKLKPGIQLATKDAVTAANAAHISDNPSLQQALLATGVRRTERVFASSLTGNRHVSNGDALLSRIYRLHMAPKITH